MFNLTWQKITRIVFTNLLLTWVIACAGCVGSSPNSTTTTATSLGQSLEDASKAATDINLSPVNDGDSNPVTAVSVDNTTGSVYAGHKDGYVFYKASGSDTWLPLNQAFAGGVLTLTAYDSTRVIVVDATYGNIHVLQNDGSGGVITIYYPTSDYYHTKKVIVDSNKNLYFAVGNCSVGFIPESGINLKNSFNQWLYLTHSKDTSQFLDLALDSSNNYYEALTDGYIYENRTTSATSGAYHWDTDTMFVMSTVVNGTTTRKNMELTAIMPSNGIVYLASKNGLLGYITPTNDTDYQKNIVFDLDVSWQVIQALSNYVYLGDSNGNLYTIKMKSNEPTPTNYSLTYNFGAGIIGLAVYNSGSSNEFYVVAESSASAGGDFYDYKM